MRFFKILLIFLISLSIFLSVGKAKTKNPIATIVMEDGSEIVIELFPKKAPNTVNNFIYLAKKGFYDGLTFHRIVPGFVIQGGDPLGTGMGGPGYSIKGEFNDISFKEGIVGMARTSNPDSAGSQFFITLANVEFLNGRYCAFGKVIKGMEVAHKIASLPRDNRDRPLNPPKIKTIKVDLKGKEYPEPEKIIPPKK
ncbi:peptidylprolyl isomerase [Candidatus Aminicenantes bacterium AC-335-A11]|jgi:peptidyl-prolyl cis-trans isomerase B (cyclophilin B)|nr:peptidylprolyl isomerase [SCandidatus Aminicenantes bacterium Aminicenantia_JdfR_composite]MCP2597303.1 peptidylprolyl isomerase [Candidatus Aminicenantes bacterium AC-335-G13]MCP2598097.1 peptidylprolyl isomerase [Candidatus Aminicenantes bacterium AC-335-L06]MCP2606239.1 peptidylprolyl isomerase [Candidatus Aminicenantes bacterium AC-708-I09]MCP2618021.1 peptidylprolyl isomerase [Candidatus Aminicenantes bacterium AC-335-A11]